MMQVSGAYLRTWSRPPLWRRIADCASARCRKTAHLLADRPADMTADVTADKTRAPRVLVIDAKPETRQVLDAALV